MKVLIADDHPMVRDALGRTVLALVPMAQISEAQNFSQVQARLAERPDLLLLDIHMPGMCGVDGVRRLRQSHPLQRIVVASGDDDPQVIRQVLALGVAGFLPKADNANALMQALRLVLAGGTYLPAYALGDFRPGQAPPKADASGLTPRQRQVLLLLMQGEPNKLIARALGLTEGTVKIHVAAILRTLQVRNRTEAVVVARNLGTGG